MEPRRPFLSALIARPEARLAGLGLTALAAVWLGFIGLEVRAAERLIMRGGYHVMTVSFVLWLFALHRLWRDRDATAP